MAGFSLIERQFIRCLFQQHFMISFFVQKCSTKSQRLTICVEIFWQNEIVEEAARKMLVKLTPGNYCIKMDYSSFSQIGLK